MADVTGGGGFCPPYFYLFTGLFLSLSLSLSLYLSIYLSIRYKGTPTEKTPYSAYYSPPSHF